MSVFNHLQQKSQKNSGFTLIELLVVIFIIGILASLLLVNILGARQRTEDVERKSNLQQMKKSLRLFYNDHQNYPHANNNQITDKADNSGATLAPGDLFDSADGTTIYMKALPEYDGYYVSADGEQFVLVIELDNASDSDISSSRNRCTGSISQVTLLNIDDLTDTDFVVCED